MRIKMLKNFSKMPSVLRATSNLKWSHQSEHTSTKETIVSVKPTAQVNKVSTTEIASTSSTNTSLNLKTKAPMTFAQMFKESQFVSLGDLRDKYLIGKIVDIVGDDLYIDYGGKFNCVCKIPVPDNPETDLKKVIKRNMNVKIRLKTFEMASYFLNSAKHLTLLESDAEFCSLFDPNNPEHRDTVGLESLKKSIDELNSDPYYY